MTKQAGSDNVERMTKKRLLLISMPPVVVIATIIVFAILPTGPGVTKSNFDRIEVGFDLAQVEEIFGRRGIWDSEKDDPEKNEPVFWRADENGAVAVIWFADGCVSGKRWHVPDETTLDKIRRWLGLAAPRPLPARRT